MKVVLLENVKGIGQKGEIKEVKDGYAMNFLIPQKKVAMATTGNAKQAELNQVKEAELTEKSIAENTSAAKKIEGKKITIKVKAQEEKLFGALSEKEINDALVKEDLKITNGKLNIATPVKTTGEHQIEVTWDGNLKASFSLIVEGTK
jgi:large subunit ribosomal protein L9